MARRKEVLLVKDVLKLGNMGDLVRVSPGYARNYLFPYGFAIAADGAAKRQIDVLREKAAKSDAEREQKAIALKKTIEGMTVQIAARVSHDDELFGSIGTKDLVAALAKSGVEVDGKQVHLHEKLKKLGKHQIELKLHRNVSVAVTLEIVNSDPNAPSLAEAMAAAAPKPADKADKGAEKPADKSAEKTAKGGKKDEAGANPAPAKASKKADAKAESAPAKKGATTTKA